MKAKYVIPLLLLSIVFISGCTAFQQKPSLTDLKVDPNVRKVGEQARISYFVTNPQATTFVGFVEFRYDDKCFSSQSTLSKQDVEVLPTISKPHSKDITIQFPYGSKGEECIGKKDITLVLYDKNSINIAFATTSIIITG